MSWFVLRRLGYTVPILLGVSLVVFSTAKIIPGDPVAALAGPGADPATVAALRARLGLDASVPVQYVTWLGHALTGDLGTSLARQTPVLGLVADAFANTLVLTAFAVVVAVLLGTAVGGVAALRPRGLAARICSGLSLLATSMPQYSVALILVTYLAAGARWFPVAGMRTVGAHGFGDLLAHLVLPGVTAALVPAGMIARLFATALHDVLAQDFTEALRARGLPRWRIAVHVVHNTVPSLLTITGLQVGYLLGGVVFVETIFSWPGLGLLVYQSISARDLPVIQAGVLISALTFVLLNVVVDVVHALVDTRVRTS